MKFINLLFIVVLLCLCGQVRAQNLLTNGDFDRQVPRYTSLPATSTGNYFALTEGFERTSTTPI